VNSRVFGVHELKYAIRIFSEANSVAMTTKFRQKYVKTAHILVLYKVGRHFCTYNRVFGIGEFKYDSGIFQGANDIAMATKFRQK